MPDGEKVAQCETSANGRFDVDDPVLRMCMHPVEARPVVDEWSPVAVGDLPRLTNAHTERDRLFDTIEEDGQVHVDMENRGLERIARDDRRRVGGAR